MTKNKRIKFVKVEADRPLLTFYPPKFEPEPRLYLELLENKAKVKPTLRNSEWISKIAKGYSASVNDTNIYEEPRAKSPSRSVTNSPRQSFQKPKIIDITNATDSDIKEFENKAINKKEEDLNNLSGSIKFGFKNKLKQKRDERDDDRRSDKDDYRRKDDDDRKRDDSDRRRDDSDRRRDDSDRRRDDDKPKKEESLLSRMLKGESEEQSQPQQTSQQQPQQTSQQQPQQPMSQIPPSLSEISEGRVQVDSNGIRNLEYITSDERDEQEKKRDLLNKFAKLKKEYNNAHIPNHTEHTDIITLQKDYSSIKKQLEIDAKSLRYKQWLLYSFLGLEILLSNFGSFDDIKGFYNYQKNSINQYESLLFELGEKNYIQDEKKWPVEIRLIGVVAMNAAFFVGGKWAERKYGVNILNIFNPINIPPPPVNNFYKPPPQQQVQQPPQQQAPGFTPYQSQQKPKMKAPEFDFEDISLKKTN